ncbi:hypothetical protein SHKM778_03130 [Streptomyces sp. KM77-8]|uniref:Uncharacterized protein n=1 Tax=Streptomyces haneummycinicus TaxID=3074435 RepID=A0AAT9H975_9ACTN
MSGLVRLQPGDFAGLGSGCPQCVQGRGVDAGQRAPGGRGGGDGAEYVALVAQHGQVSDRFAAVGEHDRQVHRDTAGVVPGPAWPQPVQGFAEGAGQRGGVRQIREQARAGVVGHPVPVGADDELGA